LTKEAPAKVGPDVTLAELGHSPDPLANAKSGRIFRILVVDDDPFCCDIIARRLAGEGYEPVTALSAHTASEAIQRQIPDAVLLDVTMPQIDGISYLRMLKESPQTKALPVLLMSASQESATQISGLDFGASDFVNKPLNYQILFARLRTHLRMKTLLEQLDEQKKLLLQLATRDDLTTAFNRRATLEALTTECLRVQRYKRPLSVLVADVDGLKKVNDSLGHGAGDELLRETAARMRQAMRDADILGRIGGDEFCIIFPETNMHQALQVADRLMSLVCQPLADLGISIGLSAGLTTADLSAPLGPDALLAQADEAMYESKRSRKNTVGCYENGKIGLIPSTTPSPDAP
jgi:two-component system, cell cycle response regulator